MQNCNNCKNSTQITENKVYCSECDLEVETTNRRVCGEYKEEER